MLHNRIILITEIRLHEHCVLEFDGKFEPICCDLEEDFCNKSYNQLIDAVNAKSNWHFKMSEFIVMSWHKIRPGLWFSIERVRNVDQFFKGYNKPELFQRKHIVYEPLGVWPAYGQKIFFENAFKQKYQGMIVSRGSYNKCQQRLYHFMDSTYRHPILRTEGEPTLLFSLFSLYINKKYFVCLVLF